MTTLLAAASRDANYTGDAIDVSADTVLRCDVSMTADLGRHPDIHVLIEDAPAAAGPWSTLVHKHFTESTWPIGCVAQLILVPANFIRLRTYGTVPGGATIGLSIP